MAQWFTNPTRNREVAGLILGLTQWVKNLTTPHAMAQTADVARILMWLGSCVIVAAVQITAAALIRSLAQEIPYVMGVALKRQKQTTIRINS